MSHTEPKNVVEVLAGMVSIDSVNPAIQPQNGGEAKLAEYLVFVAAAFGFSVRRLRVDGYGENILIVYDRGPNRPWVLFDSHMDTVGTDGMTIPPFGAEIRDGKLWGRGACDTKGSGAAMLWAMHEYSKSGRQPNNVALLFSADEEVGMRGVRSFIDNDYQTLGFGHPGVVVGEPTRMRLVVSHNGVCRARVTTHGVAVHASRPASGKSAISTMARLITGFEEDYVAQLDSRDDLTGAAQCSINTIRGGSASNVIPDRCEIEIDRRLVPGEEPDRVVADMRSAISRIGEQHGDLDYEMDVHFLAPPLSSTVSSKLVESARRALEREGLSGEPTGVTYATNAGDLSSRGIDAVVFGPGDVAQAHTREEWIDLEELKRSVRVYRSMMADE